MSIEIVWNYVLINFQFILKLLLVLGYSFFAALFSVRYVKRHLKKYNYEVDDKYKPAGVKVLTMGGICAFIGVTISLALSVFLFDKNFLGKVFIFYFVVMIYFLYGILDDLFAFKSRYDKILILLILSLPLSILVNKSTVNIPFFENTIYLGTLYALIVVPIFVMVTANMINIHAGFNGLTTGLSLILLFAAILKSLMVYGLENIIYVLPALGGMIIVWFYNRYPARWLPGNSGDLMAGAVIGSFLMVNNLFKFGFVILIPHIVNFLMDTWTLVLRKIPDVKFGKLRKDGTIEAPSSMKFKSIKFFVTHYFRLTEKQAVYVCYLVTIVFCVIGVIWF